MNRIEWNGDPRNCLLWREGGGRTIELFDINVANIARRRGIGRRLVLEMLSQIPTDTALVFAITRAGNEPAQQFYESMKWRLVGRLHRFYPDEEGGESALMYGLDL